MAEISASLVKELRDRTSLGMMECKKALVDAGGDIEKAIDDMRKSGQAKAAKKAGRTAAEGVAVVKTSADGSYGVLVEINSETDFVARDENFLAFAQKVVDQAFADKQTDVTILMAGDLETARQALIQKIGENISVRRIAMVAGGTVASYIHSNKKIGVLVALNGGDEELARDIAMHVAAVTPIVINPEEVSADIIAKEREIYTAQAQDSGKPADIVEKMIDGRIRKYLAEVSLVSQPFVKDPDTLVGNLLKKVGASATAFVRYEVGEGIEKEVVDFAAEVAAQVRGR